MQQLLTLIMQKHDKQKKYRYFQFLWIKWLCWIAIINDFFLHLKMKFYNFSELQKNDYGSYIIFTSNTCDLV